MSNIKNILKALLNSTPGGGGPSTTLNDGLVAAYHLDTDSTDSVGSYDGTDSSISYGAGHLNNCASFSGSNIVFADLELEAHSVSFWVRLNSGGALNALYKGKEGVVALYGVSGNKLDYWTSGADNVTDDAVLLSTTWQHIVVTSDGADETKIYVDGVLVQTFAFGYPMTWGRMGYDTFGNVLTGKMDEVLIYDRVLTLAEVEELYNEGDGLISPF